MKTRAEGAKRALVAAAALVVLQAALIGLPGTASAGTTTVTPTDDARALEETPTTNYGSSSSLKVEGGVNPDVNSYLKFSVSGVSGTVTRALLRVYAYNETVDGPTVASTTTGWSEGSVTWDSRPTATSGTLADQSAIAANTWVEYNVTATVRGNGTYSFGFSTTTSDAINFYSSEGANPPQLVVTTSTTSPSPTPTSTRTPTPTPSPSPTYKIAAAGDIACDPTDTGFNSGAGTSTRCHMKATADLLVNGGYTAVLALGDEQYNSGRLTQFQQSYDPSWGRIKSKTYPVPGNHEYGTSGAAGYFDYFGSAARDRTKGYYSFNIGSWHVLAINSNCTRIGGCGEGSPQEDWVTSDLAASTARCTLAFWHHPRYNTGHEGEATSMIPIWDDLYNAGAELVLSGHAHDYERFVPMDSAGRVDNTRGMRQFVVGTGGAFFTGWLTTSSNSVVRQKDTFGILELRLSATGYTWRFVPEAGKSFSDSGSATCH